MLVLGIFICFVCFLNLFLTNVHTEIKTKKLVGLWEVIILPHDFQKLKPSVFINYRGR